MQLSGTQHRNQASVFVNDTPRFEITTLEPSQFNSEMVGPTSMAFGAGPLYTRAMMGQAPSAIERENARKASSTILREDTICVEESDNLSRPDSWSMHYDCTDQAPYSTNVDDSMMTQASLLHLPKENASHDLAFFLRTTGPTAPHRRPSKIENPRRNAHTPKNALRFLRSKQKQSTGSSVTGNDGINDVPFDEGGLLSVPRGTEQKVSSTGRRYLALQVPSTKGEDNQDADADRGLALSPSIVESRVSISFADSMHSSDVLDTWFYSLSKDDGQQRKPTPFSEPQTAPGADNRFTVRQVGTKSSPIRPCASNPPTPDPESAISLADTHGTDFTEYQKESFDIARALSSHPVHSKTSSSLPLPNISLPHEEFPVRHPTLEKDIDIKHPSPRRLASYPVLLQRASSITSSLYPRSFSDSPGPPPPRSPLRLKRNFRKDDGTVSGSIERKATPRVTPSMKGVNEYTGQAQPIKPIVTTDCTGPMTPIKRPRSSGKNSVTHPAYPASRKEREERIRARKLRDRPTPIRTIDAVMNATPALPRQRLKKTRPHILIPESRPAPLTARASSTGSSNTSGKKITEYTRTPVSDVPSEGTPTTTGSKTGYTPISPTASNGSAANASMTLSPVMLVAEEIPVPKAKSPPKPAKLVVKESKSYTPRPRSASIPRSAMKRRSRQGGKTPVRSGSPAPPNEPDDTPPLPSPPPMRTLPPTPPASGSEKPGKMKAARSAVMDKQLPVPPIHENVANTSKPARKLPHVATQAMKQPKPVDVNARLEALEKQNALLSAALTAVLRTNGTLNGPIADPESPESPKAPMVWESRVARRSAASHAASSSNGSALEMYLTTRHGSSKRSQ